MMKESDGSISKYKEDLKEIDLALTEFNNFEAELTEACKDKKVSKCWGDREQNKKDMKNAYCASSWMGGSGSLMPMLSWYVLRPKGHSFR